MFLYLLVLYISVCDAEVVLLQQIEVLTYFVKEHLTLGSLLCGKKYTFKKKDTMEIIHISNKKKKYYKREHHFQRIIPPKKPDKGVIMYEKRVLFCSGVPIFQMLLLFLLIICQDHRDCSILNNLN